ncbi:MAG: class I SAM-dependent methyltransferase [Patescibacteria group bacterium]
MASDSVGWENKTLVQKYYDYTRHFYKWFWHGKTNALHYGFFDDSVTSFKDALVRTISKTVELADIQKNHRVVDLGCGIGGSVFWVAKNIGAHTTGITISGEQHKKALRLRKEYNLENHTEFTVGDFLHTPYSDEQFDRVMSIEALCHGQHVVHEVARELFRIVKSGGRIAIMDGYVGTKQLTKSEIEDIKIFEEGLTLVHLITPTAFVDALKEAGFQNVAFTDFTKNILPTTEKMYDLTRRWYWLTWLLVTMRLVPDLMLKNNVAGQVQRNLTKSRALVYGCITAEK